MNRTRMWLVPARARIHLADHRPRHAVRGGVPRARAARIGRALAWATAVVTGFGAASVAAGTRIVEADVIATSPREVEGALRCVRAGPPLDGAPALAHLRWDLAMDDPPRCARSTRIEGWKVTARLDGHEFVLHTDRPPGRTIPVRLEVR